MAVLPQLVGDVAGEGSMTTGPRGMHFVDSHTAGEPTRVIVDGGPDVGTGSLQERLARLRAEDEFRQAVIHEPRGFDALVGALLCEPTDPAAAAGVIFFNNTDYLGMCGHGAIGVAVTLHHLGRIGIGKHILETPVGLVELHLHSAQEVTIENVESYRHRSQVEVEVEGLGVVTGDIAWGGNWFFLMGSSPVPLVPENIDTLTSAALRVRAALEQQGITGAGGGLIDHFEFFGPASEGADSRNFVLCPGGAYDRSPCGTGTSAKLACLAADGRLEPGETWVQESIIGSRFRASYRQGAAGKILPSITGSAFVCGEGQLLQHPQDPFRHGIAVS